MFLIFSFIKKTHYFIFERRPEVGHMELVSTFKRGFKLIFNKEIDIFILPNTIEMLSIFRTAIKIKKIRFLLRPSNPDNTLDKEIMERIAKDTNSEKAQVEFFNSNDLNRDSNAIKSGIEMINKGYGTINIAYENNLNEEAHFSSRQKNKKEVLQKPETTDKYLQKLIESHEKLIDMLYKRKK